MRCKTDPENMELLVPGAVLEPSGDPLAGVGVSGGAARLGGDFWRSWGEDGTKMGARWAKLAASCAQDGP